MGPSEVYFTDLHATPSLNLLKKLERLVRAAGFEKIDFNRKMTAIKIHFGEPGNLAYLRPNFAAKIASMIREKGGKPYLTDCNTLYFGQRANAPDHLEAAFANGYNPLSTGCHVIIGDGVKGTDYREIEVNLEYTGRAMIGTAIADADIIISMNHFKGHEQTGFGGALKNLGMGCASVGGKLFLHSGNPPVIYRKNCTGCNLCIINCAHNAVHLDEERKAFIDTDKCTGCGQCIAVCQYDAARVQWSSEGDTLSKKIAEYSYAAVKDKTALHINFIMDVSPDCDCWGHNDLPLVPDIGIAASTDPVALDKACADLVVAAPAAWHLWEKDTKSDMSGADKFRMAHGNTDWNTALLHGEKIKLGSTSYKLTKI
ncbi:MAG: DUF362 domain-containing protein [Bacteroidales bacterium]|nr:DUF362 domain-containing protein [Bacteroidales bacterium]